MHMCVCMCMCMCPCTCTGHVLYVPHDRELHIQVHNYPSAPGGALLFRSHDVHAGVPIAGGGVPIAKASFFFQERRMAAVRPNPDPNPNPNQNPNPNPNPNRNPKTLTLTLTLTLTTVTSGEAEAGTRAYDGDRRGCSGGSAHHGRAGADRCLDRA